MARNARVNTEQQLKAAQADVSHWQDVFRHEAWKQLVAFLEMRYTDCVVDEKTTVEALLEQKHRMQFIREIFGFVHYDFDIAKALAQDLQTMRVDDEGLPEKESFI